MIEPTPPPEGTPPEAPIEPQPDAPADPLVCPECGKTFDRTQSLALHRSRAHGVKGQSRQARSRKRGRPPKQAQAGDRDRTERALLKVLYPEGVMPVGAMPRIREWLDTAHKLTS